MNLRLQCCRDVRPILKDCEICSGLTPKKSWLGKGFAHRVMNSLHAMLLHVLYCPIYRCLVVKCWWHLVALNYLICQVGNSLRASNLFMDSRATRIAVLMPSFHVLWIFLSNKEFCWLQFILDGWHAENNVTKQSLSQSQSRLSLMCLVANHEIRKVWRSGKTRYCGQIREWLSNKKEVQDWSIEMWWENWALRTLTCVTPMEWLIRWDLKPISRTTKKGKADDVLLCGLIKLAHDPSEMTNLIVFTRVLPQSLFRIFLYWRFSLLSRWDCIWCLSRSSALAYRTTELENSTV